MSVQERDEAKLACLGDDLVDKMTVRRNALEVCVDANADQSEFLGAPGNLVYSCPPVERLGDAYRGQETLWMLIAITRNHVVTVLRIEQAPWPQVFVAWNDNRAIDSIIVHYLQPKLNLSCLRDR